MGYPSPGNSRRGRGLIRTAIRGMHNEGPHLRSFTHVLRISGFAIYAQTPCCATACINICLCPIMNRFRRDISILNVMMDGSMYPNSWHPCDDDMDRFDFSVEAKYYTRSECPPRYYLIDFGLSRRYDPKDG